jgi:hypothetical protein
MEPKQILQRESPAIVAVYSVDKSGKPFAYGSGFIVRSNGVVVTNFHVIKGAYDAQIKLKNGEVYENVLVLDYDQRHDVAVLKIRAISLPTVTLGDSAVVEPGDRAYAIGNPEGFDYTISDGLISARRVIEGTEQLQITVPISHGSSGGPLYNVYGQVIGITSAGVEEGQNLNFAVPLKYVLPMLDSPPKNITLAQLTEQTKPVEQATSREKSQGPTTFRDPNGWMELTLPVGWQMDEPPPQDLMLSASKSGATMVAFRADSRNADDAFNQLRKALADKYGRLSNYSEKIKVDEKDGRHLRMQTFQASASGGSVLLFIGAFQRDTRVLGLLGVFSTNDAYHDFIEVLKTLQY